jgi:hypothetical protein
MAGRGRWEIRGMLQNFEGGDVYIIALLDFARKLLSCSKWEYKAIVT